MSSDKKILSRKQAAKKAKEIKKKGKKVGLTNGVFDLIHSGHVHYLEKAKKKCDVLFVSINTDSSTRKFKGKDRPFNSLKERQKVIAGLECVDFVLNHPQTGMKKTAELIKPDIYFKGGDYKKKKLKSRKTIEKFGGKIIILPLSKGKSTTSVVDKILKTYAIKEPKQKATKSKTKQKKKAVFLDRDGTINEQIEFLHEAKKFRFLHNALKGIKEMQRKGFEIILITNQQGIGLGYYSKEDFFKVNKKMLTEMNEKKIKIMGIYFCPHSEADNCNCRKPKPGLIKTAAQEHSIDLKKSFMVGDTERDIKAGKKAGVKTILVSKTRIKTKTKPDFTVKDLAEASKKIN
jgi:rfaE bifunctional protein nucleotidyltransferase chain/domain